MSFALTKDQIVARTKTVTRRKGWKFLKAGDVVNACVKCMGLRPGEKIERLCQIRVVNVERESLETLIRKKSYGWWEARQEGFPGMSGEKFVEMFCKNMKVPPSHVVTRIEFEYIGGGES